MKYFNFPVKLIQGVLQSNQPRTLIDFLDEAFDYHMYRHLMKMPYLEVSEKSHQVIDYDFNGEPIFKRDIEVYKKVVSYYDTTVNNAIPCIKKGRKLILEALEKEYKVFVGINRDVWFDYYQNKKSEFEIQCLMAHLALKSILGKKKYAKTDNEMMFARMLGKETKADYRKLKKGLCITEYKRNKIIDELVANWGLKYYARYTRGFYFGYEETTTDELAFIAEKRKAKNKATENKRKQNEAFKKLNLR